MSLDNCIHRVIAATTIRPTGFPGPLPATSLQLGQPAPCSVIAGHLPFLDGRAQHTSVRLTLVWCLSVVGSLCAAEDWSTGRTHHDLSVPSRCTRALWAAPAQCRTDIRALISVFRLGEYLRVGQLGCLGARM